MITDTQPEKYPRPELTPGKSEGPTKIPGELTELPPSDFHQDQSWPNFSSGEIHPQGEMNSGPHIGESAPHFLLSPSFSLKRPHRFICLLRGKRGGFTPSHLPTLFLSTFLDLIVWIVSGTVECRSSSNFPGGGGATLGLNTAVFWLANEGKRNLNRERDIFSATCPSPGLPDPSQHHFGKRERRGWKSLF